MSKSLLSKIKSLKLCLPCLVQLGRQKSPQDLASRSLGQTLQMKDTSPKLLVSGHLAVNPEPDLIEDLLLRTARQVHLPWREAYIGEGDFGCLGVVVNCTNCSIDHVWMTQENILKLGGGDLESRVVSERLAGD